MAIIVLALSTVMVLAWIVLLGRANQEDWVAAAYSKVLGNLSEIDRLRLKGKERLEKLSKYHGIAAYGVRFLPVVDFEKKIKKLGSDNRKLQEGDLKSLSVFVIPGYVLQREFEAIGRGSAHKTIMAHSYELYGKKHAGYITKNLLAKLLSYPIIGVASTLALGAILLVAGSVTVGAAIVGVGTLIVLVLTFTIYDDLREKVSKRRCAISKQFPNVVSKLALLVTSGMIMDRAWKLAAHSQELELYREMRKTSEELDNLVSPEVAYSGFINRCNTKETAKLASAIMQNLSKGNAEIGRLLKDMAYEAWQERRNIAKRDAEKANSKLMIPTMLLFLAILVMLMVPIAMNFSGI